MLFLLVSLQAAAEAVRPPSPLPGPSGVSLPRGSSVVSHTSQQEASDDVQSSDGGVSVVQGSAGVASATGTPVGPGRPSEPKKGKKRKQQKVATATEQLEGVSNPNNTCMV